MLVFLSFSLSLSLREGRSAATAAGERVSEWISSILYSIPSHPRIQLSFSLSHIDVGPTVRKRERSGRPRCCSRFGLRRQRRWRDLLSSQAKGWAESKPTNHKRRERRLFYTDIHLSIKRNTFHVLGIRTAATTTMMMIWNAYSVTIHFTHQWTTTTWQKSSIFGRENRLKGLVAELQQRLDF